MTPVRRLARFASTPALITFVGARVALHTVEGGGHSSSGEGRDWLRRSGAVCHDIDASALLLEFFLRSARPLD